METERIVLSDIHYPETSLRLSPGNVLAILTDDGPRGICGQSMSITCPHTQIHLFDDEAQFREWAEQHKDGFRRGKNPTMRFVVIGDYGSPGTFVLVKHGAAGPELYSEPLDRETVEFLNRINPAGGSNA